MYKIIFLPVTLSPYQYYFCLWIFHTFSIGRWGFDSISFLCRSCLCHYSVEFLFACSLSGGELFDRIADDNYKMSESEVIKYIRQICEGLQSMHELGIVHLDIKVAAQLFSMQFITCGLLVRH